MWRQSPLTETFTSVLVAERAVGMPHDGGQGNGQVSTGVLAQAVSLLCPSKHRASASHCPGSSCSARTRVSSPISRRAAAVRLAWISAARARELISVFRRWAKPARTTTSRLRSSAGAGAAPVARRHAQKRRGHLRRRVKAARRQVDGLSLRHGPGVENGQRPIVRAARPRANPRGELALDHDRHPANARPEIEKTAQQRGGDRVRQVRHHACRRPDPAQQRGEIHGQGVGVPEANVGGAARPVGAPSARTSPASISIVSTWRARAASTRVSMPRPVPISITPLRADARQLHQPLCDALVVQEVLPAVAVGGQPVLLEEGARRLALTRARRRAAGARTRSGRGRGARRAASERAPAAATIAALSVQSASGGKIAREAVRARRRGDALRAGAGSPRRRPPPRAGPGLRPRARGAPCSRARRWRPPGRRRRGRRASRASSGSRARTSARHRRLEPAVGEREPGSRCRGRGSAKASSRPPSRERTRARARPDTGARAASPPCRRPRRRRRRWSRRAASAPAVLHAVERRVAARDHEAEVGRAAARAPPAPPPRGARPDGGRRPRERRAGRRAPSRTRARPAASPAGPAPSSPRCASSSRSRDPRLGERRAARPARPCARDRARRAPAPRRRRADAGRAGCVRGWRGSRGRPRTTAAAISSHELSMPRTRSRNGGTPALAEWRSSFSCSALQSMQSSATGRASRRLRPISSPQPSHSPYTPCSIFWRACVDLRQQSALALAQAPLEGEVRLGRSRVDLVREVVRVEMDVTADGALRLAGQLIALLDQDLPELVEVPLSHPRSSLHLRLPLTRLRAASSCCRASAARARVGILLHHPIERLLGSLSVVRTQLEQGLTLSIESLRRLVALRDSASRRRRSAASRSCGLPA